MEAIGSVLERDFLTHDATLNDLWKNKGYLDGFDLSSSKCNIIHCD